MALTTLSPLATSLTQSLNTNIMTTNFTTLPFLTLGNTTTDLPFLVPDPSLFSTNPPSFLLNEILSSDFLNSNSDQTFPNYDNTFDSNGTVGVNSSSFDDNNGDTVNPEEEVNPFLAMDYNFYDYNPYDPNSTFVHEPYVYSAGGSDSGEAYSAQDDEVMRLWDGVDVPYPIWEKPYSAFTDLNPWFLWTPPIFCFLLMSLVILPCVVLKLKDDRREKLGFTRKYGTSRKRRILRLQPGEMRAEDLECQAVPPAPASHPRQPGDAYSENVLYIEENDSSMKKENAKLVSKCLPMVKPPVDYTMEEEIRAAREALQSSKEEGGKENLELHRHSSSSGSLTPTGGAAASGETSLGSSSGPERRAEGDEVSEEDEEVKAHRSGNFSTAHKTYSKLTGRNRDLYSNGAGFGPPARKSSNREEGGSPPVGSADPDWGMY